MSRLSFSLPSLLDRNGAFQRVDTVLLGVSLSAELSAEYSSPLNVALSTRNRVAESKSSIGGK